ncbi:helix-turn-helix transcriptional regulator [Saccharothrix xinjiangensis]|uniref:helix-turn-helix transcriptional regulator n=1 Tax=Saccharothrix xinjiangensis TaxID=204798 RepID=UPI0031D9A4A7
MTPAATCRRPPARSGRAVGEPAGAAVTVAVRAADALLPAGAAAVLGRRRDIAVSCRAVEADVLLLVEEEVFDERSVGLLRGAGVGSARGAEPRCVVVADEFRDGGLERAVDAGVVAVVPLREATGDRVAAAALAERDGVADLPPRLQGLLLERLRRREPGPDEPTGVADRERRVLRLISEGLDTGEVAGALGCSERTVKYALQAFMARHGLTTRVHAVAFALRAGLI